MEAETTGIMISSGAVGAICTLVGAWVKAKFSKNPQPFETKQVNDCVSVKECNRRMQALDDRVTRLEQKVDTGFGKIEDKLEAMDRKSEERSAALHRRLDKLFERIVK